MRLIEKSKSTTDFERLAAPYIIFIALFLQRVEVAEFLHRCALYCVCHALQTTLGDCGDLLNGASAHLAAYLATVLLEVFAAQLQVLNCHLTDAQIHIGIHRSVY